MNSDSTEKESRVTCGHGVSEPAPCDGCELQEHPGPTHSARVDIFLLLALLPRVQHLRAPGGSRCGAPRTPKAAPLWPPPYLIHCELALCTGQLPVAGGELPDEVVAAGGAQGLRVSWDEERPDAHSAALWGTASPPIPVPVVHINLHCAGSKVGLRASRWHGPQRPGLSVPSGWHHMPREGNRKFGSQWSSGKGGSFRVIWVAKGKKKEKKKQNTTKNPVWSCMLAGGRCCVLSYCCPIAHTTAVALGCRTGPQYRGQLWRNVARAHSGGYKMCPGLWAGPGVAGWSHSVGWVKAAPRNHPHRS